MPSTLLRNSARSVVIPPATKSRKSPLFRGDLSTRSAARTRSRARKYAGCWEIAAVRRKNIGHATNWLTGKRNDRISVSRRDRPLIHCSGDRGIEKAIQLFLLLFSLIFLTASQSRHGSVKALQHYFSRFHVDLLYLVSYRSFAVDNSLFAKVPSSNRTLYDFSIPRTIPSLTSLVVTFFPNSSRTVVTLF